MIKIIRAEKSHLSELIPLFEGYRVFYKQVSNPDGAKQFLTERMDNRESIIFIAYEDNIATGFTQLYPCFSSVSMQRLFILNDLYVEKSSRAKGIGEALLNRAKEYAIAKGAKGLALETGKDNPAQKLYERLDWKLETKYLNYFWSV